VLLIVLNQPIILHFFLTGIHVTTSTTVAESDQHSNTIQYKSNL